jgi:hypothetical protein
MEIAHLIQRSYFGAVTWIFNQIVSIVIKLTSIEQMNDMQDISIGQGLPINNSVIIQVQKYANHTAVTVDGYPFVD